MAPLFRKIAPLLQSTTCYGRVSDVISIYDTQQMYRERAKSSARNYNMNI